MGKELDRRNRGSSSHDHTGVLTSFLARPQLCNDNFEENVLPYSAENTGLHLHGINECSWHFQTQPTAVLDAFAREWGFIPTASFELPSLQEVKAFTKEVGRSSVWNGEALEGFVVRSTVRCFDHRGGGANWRTASHEP